MVDHMHSGHRQRVKQRYIDHGIDAFAPHELVELLLFFGIPQKDTNPLAHRLMDEFDSMRGILNAERDILLRVQGMTPHAATLLNLVGDIGRYCEQEQMPAGSLLINTASRVKYFRPRFDGVGVEVVWMVSLNQNKQVIAAHRLTAGMPTMTEISARDVVRFALADNAYAVVMAHNHPSGLALPSRLDVDTTIAIASSLKGVGIQLDDHIIFAKDYDSISFYDTASLRPALRGETVK